MKNIDKKIDFEDARAILTKACEIFIRDNANNYWANKSFIGKSRVQIVKDLIKEFKTYTSTDQLICKVGEYKSDEELTRRLQSLVVREIYQTPEKDIDKLGMTLASEALARVTRGYGMGIVKIVPDTDAAIGQFFKKHLASAKSAKHFEPIELR